MSILTRNEIVLAAAFGADLHGANLYGTALDPSATPNGEAGLFVGNGDTVRGYRTRSAGHIDKYRDDRIYSADWFSISDTECHPGLYLWPTVDMARGYASTGELIEVETNREDIHQAGAKWRCRWFRVVGTATEREGA